MRRLKRKQLGWEVEVSRAKKRAGELRAALDVSQGKEKISSEIIRFTDTLRSGSVWENRPQTKMEPGSQVPPASARAAPGPTSPVGTIPACKDIHTSRTGANKIGRKGAEGETQTPTKDKKRPLAKERGEMPAQPEGCLDQPEVKKQSTKRPHVDSIPQAHTSKHRTPTEYLGGEFEIATERGGMHAQPKRGPDQPVT